MLREKRYYNVERKKDITKLSEKRDYNVKREKRSQW